jgi:hypothetical protein
VPVGGRLSSGKVRHVCIREGGFDAGKVKRMSIFAACLSLCKIGDVPTSVTKGRWTFVIAHL